MKSKTYQKASVTCVEACTEGCLLVGSDIQTLSVTSVGQDLTPSIDLSDETNYYIEWD